MKMKQTLQAQCQVETPWGRMTLAASARGLAGAWFEGQRHHPGALALPEDPLQPHLAQAQRELAAYAANPQLGFSVALDAVGTPFQQAVWKALLGIAPGACSSYGAIARQLGRPQAARAVGAAVGRNPLSVVVPCHRVLGSAGALTGYAGGLQRKQALLRHEGVQTLSA